MSTVKVDTLKTTGDVQVDTIKAWGHANAAQTTVNDSLNITSLTDTGTGDATWNWANNFASAYYFPSVQTEGVAANGASAWVLAAMQAAPAAGSVRTVDANGGPATNVTYADSVTAISAVGDLA